MKSELFKFVTVDSSEERVQRVWARITPRLAVAAPKPPWLMRIVLVGALASAAGAGALIYSLREAPSSVWQNAVLDTESDAMSVNLGEGSTMQLGAKTRVEVAESDESSVRLNLVRGKLLCDVSHRPGRQFSVFAGGVEVRVVGTRFRVGLDPTASHVDVDVERGTVEVRSAGEPGQVRRLSAGQRWSVPRRITPVLPPRSAETAPAAVNAAPPASIPTTDADALRPASRRIEARADAGKEADSTPDLESASARQLFDIASSARRSGSVALAARAYDALVTRFPRDGRAGLAAFELGRLRLERMSNPGGAAQAFERAIALAPGAGFREDAMARLVDAYAALGAADACSKARRAYLDNYPAGVHRTAVTAKCAGRF